MVTEEEVRQYRYQPTMHADGRRTPEGKHFAWYYRCIDNPRVWCVNDTRKGNTYLVDGGAVPDPTPAVIAELLNTQEPRELTAMDVFQLTENEEG